jgi:hypothetical protein
MPTEKARKSKRKADTLEPPTYTSVPLERVGAVEVVCVAGKEVPPLPYPLDDFLE